MEKEAKMKDPNVKHLRSGNYKRNLKSVCAKQRKARKRARKNKIKFDEDSQLIYNWSGWHIYSLSCFFTEQTCKNDETLNQFLTKLNNLSI